MLTLGADPIATGWVSAHGAIITLLVRARDEEGRLRAQVAVTPAEVIDERHRVISGVAGVVDVEGEREGLARGDGVSRGQPACRATATLGGQAKGVPPMSVVGFEQGSEKAVLMAI